MKIERCWFKRVSKLGKGKKRLLTSCVDYHTLDKWQRLTLLRRRSTHNS